MKYDRFENFLLGTGLVLASVVAIRSVYLGIIKALTDQNSHLNFSRLIFDSMTPGISQMGFWPPLLHFLMAPFTAVKPLYETGLAGMIVLIPVLLVGTIFLYRTTLLLTNNRFFSIGAGLLFLLNPYILYYSSTPMMEVLFLANLFGVAYFLALWFRDQKLKWLILTGIFISLASLSRYEGLILIPLVVVIVGIHLIWKKNLRSQIEALLILFSVLAFTGAVYILAYSYIFSGNFLSFAGGTWLKNTGDAFATRHNLLASLKYIAHASYYMLGKPLVFAAFACFPLLFLVFRKHFSKIAVLLVLLSPLVFVLVALFSGSYSISVPELAPFGFFNNDRYGLTWIGFAIVGPITIASFLYEKLKTFAWPKLFSAASLLGLLAIIVLGGLQFYQVVFVQNFLPVREDINVPSKEQLQVSAYLRKNYDYGKVLITRADNDPIISDSNIPLNNYLFEGNYLYYSQSLQQPWLFARWVVIHNPGDGDAWSSANDAIERDWSKSSQFGLYYDLVIADRTREVFKLNDARVRQMATSAGYNLGIIPSLNQNISSWNPGIIYSQIKSPAKVFSQGIIQNNSVSKSQVSQELVNIYKQDLQPLYRLGFMTKSGETSSESQSYGLLQSYFSTDLPTFDRIWKWTKNNLQTRSDSLLSWKYSYGSFYTTIQDFSNLFTKPKPQTLILDASLFAQANKLQITDSNSATDADQDTAYALLRAGQQWNRKDYLNAGVAMLPDIWNKETAQVLNRRLVIAGNWADNGSSVVVNPSYFSPFEYRLFAKYDPVHDWNQLITDNYALLAQLQAMNLRGDNSILPPNWLTIDKTTGSVSMFSGKPDSFDYSYDAFRVFWRVAMDYRLNKDPRALAYLKTANVFSSDQPCTLYQNLKCDFVSGTLAGPLSLSSIVNPSYAESLVAKNYVSKGDLSLPDNNSFFSTSWHWFGLLLWSNS